MIYRHVYQADNSDAYHKLKYILPTLGSVGKGVFGGFGAKVKGAGVSCADTIAMEAEPISRIESFIFDRLLLLLVLNRR